VAANGASGSTASATCPSSSAGPSGRVGHSSATPATTRIQSPRKGITDAFRDAELLVQAIADGLEGGRSLDDALAEYEQRRNEHALPIYEFTHQLAALAPPPPEMQALFGALRTNPEQANRFFGTLAGTVPLPEFFAPDNLARIVGAAPSRATSARRRFDRTPGAWTSAMCWSG
jgi:hypothetical protein